MDKKELTSLIKQIADCRGVSGSEKPVAQLCRDIMSRYTCNAEIKNGSPTSAAAPPKSPMCSLTLTLTGWVSLPHTSPRRAL